MHLFIPSKAQAQAQALELPLQAQLIMAKPRSLILQVDAQYNIYISCISNN